jgi:SpoVK/Ycf46/Vps4 family AAA+-type ATPase
MQEIPVDKLRHHMVLPEAVERRFHRIEKEFAARTRLAKHGLKPRHRILLYGPPGCGKSLGAERLAWNTGLPLRKVRFDTLLSSYFGETMANLRKVFDAAQASPCALFLDECDSLARSRTQRNDVGEVTRITNALLEMLEDYKGDGLVIAATNLDSALDSALFRRFDEVLKIPLPGIEEIGRMLETTLSPMEKDATISWRELAQSMDGMSGSEVVHVAQNAAKHCVLEGRRRVSEADIRHALAEAQEHNQAH